MLRAVAVRVARSFKGDKDFMPALIGGDGRIVRLCTVRMDEARAQAVAQVMLRNFQGR